MESLPEVKFPLHGDGEGQYVFDANDDMILQIRGWGHLHTTFGESRAGVIQGRIQNYAVASMNNMEDLVIASDKLVNFAREVQEAFKKIGVDPPSAPISDVMLSIARYRDQLVHGEKK